MRLPEEVPVQMLEMWLHTYDQERRNFEAILRNTLRIKADAGDAYHDHWRNFVLWRIANALEMSNIIKAYPGVTTPRGMPKKGKGKTGASPNGDDLPT